MPDRRPADPNSRPALIRNPDQLQQARRPDPAGPDAAPQGRDPDPAGEPVGVLRQLQAENPHE